MRSEVWQYVDKVKLAGRLVITHHSPERTDAQLREMEKEAMADMSNLRFAREGDVLDLAPVHQ